MPAADRSARITREPVPVKRGGHEPIPRHEKAPLEISAGYLAAAENQEDFPSRVQEPSNAVFKSPQRELGGAPVARAPPNSRWGLLNIYVGGS